MPYGASVTVGQGGPSASGRVSLPPPNIPKSSASSGAAVSSPLPGPSLAPIYSPSATGSSHESSRAQPLALPPPPAASSSSSLSSLPLPRAVTPSRPPASTSALNSGGPPPQENSNRALNVQDALSYLDNVKVVFRDRPEVYNNFLDIMKDFKSQTIDTPGVINRVSTLFRGHISLIRGFNAFLPPGYHIECSENPHDPVRVTTPSGTTISDIGGGQGGRQQPRPNADRSVQYSQPHGADSYYSSQQQQPQPHTLPSSTSGPSPSQQAGPPPPQQQQQQQVSYGRQSAVQSSYSPQTSQVTPQANRQAPGPYSSSLLQQQQQQPPPPQAPSLPHYGGPSSTSYPANASASPPTYHPPPPQTGPRPPSRAPPMEFDHAINYVNKIKMRFAAEPDHYREFLDILQTYQRDSRPINEVYEKVRRLFANAPDLLNEFKQFLPEFPDSVSAPPQPLALQAGQAHSSVGASPQVVPSNLSVLPPPPGGGVAPSPAQAVGGGTGGPATAGMGTPTTSMAIAPSISTPGKSGSRKRRVGPGVGTPPTATKRRAKHKPEDSGSPVYAMNGGTVATTAPDTLGTVPPATIVQGINGAALATEEELSFFERVKRFIGRTSTYNEFLKLLNMFNQEIIDPKTLVERVEPFIGGDRELFEWFKNFVGFDDLPEEFDNPEDSQQESDATGLKPVVPRVSLETRKSYGHSYRLLPACETKAKCSGRDAMCWEVLNDRWASHPTWASEESEFVHHRKSQYEDALFRCEEERHEMDINIETNLYVIRLLMPIARQIEQMTPEEKQGFKLPKGFGGYSEALPRRALRKIYDEQRALEVLDALHTHPAVAAPIVLKRLKQKDEDWRRQRREMNKVWREIDAKNFYKSLDHQGPVFKSSDRKAISAKNLIAEIEMLRREQQEKLRHDQLTQPGSVESALKHRYQLHYRFVVPRIIGDLTELVFTNINRQNQITGSERDEIGNFFNRFFGELFGIDKPLMTIDNDDDEEEDQVGGVDPDKATAYGNGGDKDDQANGDKDDDRMKVEEPELSNVPPQEPEESLGAKSNEDRHIKAEPSATAASAKQGLISSHSWVQGSSSVNCGDRGDGDQGADGKRCDNSRSISRAFYGNSTFYVFLRIFQKLYARLEHLYNIADECRENSMFEERSKSVAAQLSLSEVPELLRPYDLAKGDYYEIFLDFASRFISGDIDQPNFEEVLRILFGTKAYKLSNVDKLVQALAKQAQNIVSDSRCTELISLFDKNVVSEKSTLRSHIYYRMKVETSLGPDESVYRIDYLYTEKAMTIQLLMRSDMTLDQAVTEEERWGYYVDSYVLFEPTEGVPQRSSDSPPVYLNRTLRTAERPYDIHCRSGLEIKIAVNTYKLCFLTGSEDVYTNHTRRNEAMVEDKAKGRMVMNERLREEWRGRATNFREWLGRRHEGQDLDEWWKEAP
ncbi:hypothetical protein EV182_001669, partial [Spiromyces aspiralis]